MSTGWDDKSAIFAATKFAETPSLLATFSLCSLESMRSSTPSTETF
jgi:hypothetical protein